MSTFTKVKNVIKDPNRILLYLSKKNLLNWVQDETYLKIMYRCNVGKSLNFKELTSFNEKLQWLKLYDRKPEYINYVDKLAVRTHIKETIGEQYLIPILDVYNTVGEINWESLPKKFVMKCTHGSGSNIICTDKDSLDFDATLKKLNKWMNNNWFWFGREWPYKNIKPRIICEKYMVDESGTELKDYKFFCFNGEPKLVQVDYGRFVDHKRNLYDTKWKYIDASISYPTDPTVDIKKPENFDEMLRLARVLSKGYPHVRVDFYYVRNEIYFGELTFYHGSGYERFEPEEFGELLGSWIELPKNSNAK